MFNPIKETFRNIFKEKRLFFSSFLSLIVVFVLLDTFIFGIFNLNDFKSKMENSNQGIVYVKTMTQDEITNFQGKLLQIKGIESIKYTSKEKALQSLEQELNVDLSEEENPLLDSFYIYLGKNTDANQLKMELQKNPEIEEIDLRADEINKVNTFSKKLDNILLYGGSGIVVFTIILLSNITSFTVKARRNEIRDLVASGVRGIAIKFTFFLEGLLLVILTSLIGFYGFYRLQLFIVEGLSILNSNIISNSTFKELTGIYLFSLVLGLLIIIYSNFIGLHGYYKKKKNKEKKEEVKIEDKIEVENEIKEVENEIKEENNNNNN